MTITHGDHAFNWECSSHSRTVGIDSGTLCRHQWGSGYKPVLNGNHSYDWSCTNWSEASNKVVPVVIVSREYFFDIDEVNTAIQIYADRMLKTQSWYENHMHSGKTFSLTKPVIQLSLKSKAEWHNLSCLTSIPEHRPVECPDHTKPGDRGKLFYAMVNEVKYIFNNEGYRN